MAKVDKKYQEDFKKLMQTWEKLCASPSFEYHEKVVEDLMQFKRDLDNMKY